MTVTANTTRNQYSAGNQQNTYAYTFQIHDASDLKVYIGDELKSLNTHYTVTGVGSGTGGNVVFDLGVDGNGDPIYIPENTVVSIFLAMDLDRDTNYQPSGAFLAADVNNDFDRLWIASNQQQTDINRSVRLQDTDADASMVLPKIADRADKLLGFSSVLSGATPVTIDNNYAQWNIAYDNMITGMQLPSNGILRLSQQDGSDYTVDLDSRYHNIGTDIPDADISESSVTQHRTAMLDIPNNVKAKFGNGDELEIYYDGTTSVIQESGNGNLAILGDFLFLGNPDGTENYFTAQDGTGVGLYHNGTLKISTSAAGITVSGTITATDYNNTNWDTAYGWGNHASAGYLTSFDITTQTDPKYLRADENDTTTGTLTAAGLIAGGLTYPTSDGSANQVLVTDGNGTLSFANQSGGGGGNGSSQWTTSGSDIYYNSGNVGIGTASPQSPLHVAGDIRLDNASYLRSETSSGGSVRMLGINAGNVAYVGPIDGGPSGTIYNASSSSAFASFYTAGSEKMRIATDGNVGIGTTSPSGNLHINGDSGTVLKIGDSTNNVAKGIEFLSGTSTDAFMKLTGSSGTLEISSGRNASWGGEVVFSTDTVERMRIATSGNVGIGTASPTRDLSVNGTVGVGNGTIETLVSFSDRGIIGTQSNHDLEIRTNGSERMRIDSSGKVGIGTTSPSRKLVIQDTGAQMSLLSANTGSSVLNLGDTDDDNIGRIQYDNQNNKMVFRTNTVDRLTIDSSGNVGIGTASPESGLHVQNNPLANGVITVERDTKIKGTITAGNSTGLTIDVNNTQGGTEALRFSGNGSERMRIDSSGNVLVGKTVGGALGTAGIELRPNNLYVTSTSSVPIYANRNTDDGDIIQLRKDNSTVGSIGSIAGGIEVTAPIYLVLGCDDTGIRIASNEYVLPYNPSTDALKDGTVSLGVASARFKNLFLSGGVKGNNLTFSGDGSNEHARIDSSGNLLVGKTATGTDNGVQIEPAGAISLNRDGSTPLYLNRKTSDGTIADFRKDGTTVGSIGSRAGLVTYITSGGTYSGLDFGTDINPMKSGALSDGQVNLGASGQRFLNLYLSGNVHTGDGTAASPAYTFGDDTDTGIFSPAADTIAFSEGGTEAMRISSSGNVGIGKTDPLRKIDMAYAKTADDTIGLRINNTATSYDGKVISVCKGASSAEQGVIGYADGFGLQSFYIAAGVAGLRCQTEFGSSPRLSPCNSSGTLRDNTTDLGASNARFDDIYATNTSIISTSDSTLKQDVETLTDAEERVAIACKGLLRKFRWRDAVAEKGDEARIHFGIMAQDLRDAFTAEGLDAHKYGMFCSNTWWEHEDEYYPTADSAPEGATEVTRMGVRYSELLAFIISAI